MMKGRIYAAHAIEDYNSMREKQYLRAIKKKWPKHEIINPNGLYKNTGDFLQNYKREIKKCDILIVLERGGYIPRGEYRECIYARDNMIPIYVFRKGIFLLVKSVVIVNEDDWSGAYAKVIAIT